MSIGDMVNDPEASAGGVTKRHRPTDFEFALAMSACAAGGVSGLLALLPGGEQLLRRAHDAVADAIHDAGRAERLAGMRAAREAVAAELLHPTSYPWECATDTAVEHDNVIDSAIEAIDRLIEGQSK